MLGDVMYIVLQFHLMLRLKAG